MQFFVSLKLLMALLGSSWPLLGRSGPKICSKICSKSYNFWVQFWIPFFWGLGFLWVPFGSLLGPLEALLRGLCSQKPLKTNWFFKVFENAGFWFFEAPDGSFGLILALLGRSDPKMGSKMTFNIFLKSFRKIV